MAKKVLAFGELLWDLFPDGPVLGGAPANFACRTQALGSVSFLASRVGSDDLGRQALARIGRLGMDTHSIQTDPERPTGTVEVTVGEAGAPAYHIALDTAYDRIEPTPELLRVAGEADALCFGTLAQRADVSRETLHALWAAGPSALKFFDVNFRQNHFSVEMMEASLAQTDILKVNEAEAGALARMFGVSEGTLAETARRFIERWGLGVCLVTLGARGALAAGSGGETVYEPGYCVRLMDTCGAGDAFAAGFLYEHLAGGSLRQCCRLGNALGAIVSTQKGATQPVTREEVMELLRYPGERVGDSGLEAFAG